MGESGIACAWKRRGRCVHACVRVYTCLHAREEEAAWDKTSARLEHDRMRRLERGIEKRVREECESGEEGKRGIDRRQRGGEARPDTWAKREKMEGGKSLKGRWNE
eukprot:2185335-Pleurochrysis_carterae.AAC.2